MNDRNKHRFEGLWPLPNGVSYNSYIIDDDKVALVDTVEVDFFTQFLENIHEVIGDRPIDYGRCGSCGFGRRCRCGILDVGDCCHWFLYCIYRSNTGTAF